MITSRLSILLATLLPISAASAATLIWEENFGTLAPSTAISTGNTSFGGLNASNGSLTAVASTIGSGSSLQITAATTGGTAAGAWAGAGGFGALTSMTMGFTLNLSTMNSGALGFYMGNGNTVAGNFNNYNFNDGHFLWDVSILASTGSLRYRDASGNYQDTGFILQENTTYQFLIQVNATANPLDGLAANSMTLYVNGTAVATGLQLRQGTANANGFRIGGRSTTASGDIVAEIDDLKIWNGIQPIPEPSAPMLLLAGTALTLTRRYRPGK